MCADCLAWRDLSGAVRYEAVVRDLNAIADRVTYVGSGEHKRFPNPLCDPRLRSDASDCDAVDPTLSQDPARLTAWLREAIRRGQVSPEFEGEFPRKAWARVPTAGGELTVEARLTNSGLGQYKGYFVDLSDVSAPIRRQLRERGAWAGVLP